MLTPKQTRFVDEYMVSLNGTQAAIRAGYSAKSARVIACENLKKTAVATEISKRMDRRKRRLEAENGQVVAELAKIAFASLRGITDANGDIKPPGEWPPEAWDGIESFYYGEKFSRQRAGEKRNRVGYRARVKLKDKVKALATLLEYLH